MTYAPTKYNDVDLYLKANREIGSTKAKYDAVVEQIQRMLNDLGSTDAKGQPLKVDGLAGPKTQQSVLKFQEACGIPRTGVLDALTYDAMDWRVYGDINGSWTHLRTRTSQTGPGGRAYVAKGGWAYNLYLTPDTPVNTYGLTREGQRLSDVIEAFRHRSLGYEGAVNRNQVGTSSLSTHALGVAGDDMGDQNRDRIVDADEMLLLKGDWDYLFARAQGFEAVGKYQTYRVDGVDKKRNATWRGRDRLVVMVLGNKRIPGGDWLFPNNTHNTDTSWSAARNTPKSLSATTHVAPFHHHTDCAIGAPYGSPFS